MQMYDMSEERENGPVTAGESKKEKFYPSTYLSSKKLPDMAKYDVGDKCKLVSEVKVIGKRERENGEVELEVETLRCGVMKGKVSKDEYMKMSNEEKDKIDEEEVMSKE